MSARVSVERQRKVSRVLVMLEYGEGHPCNGEVFDLTALATELAAKDEKHQHSRVELTVRGGTDYSADRLTDGSRPLSVEAGWDGMVAFQSSGQTAWLDDAVNAAMGRMEQGDAAVILKSIRKQEKKLEMLKEQLKDHRLAEAAGVRAKYPVCRITESALPLVAESEARDGEEGGR